MARVAVLHPGDMGAAVGAALRTSGHQVGWLPAGRSPQTRRRAAAEHLDEFDDIAGCDVVLSICPPANARDVATAVAGFTGCYVDANAISPTVAAEVAAIVTAGGADYVDGGIIGSPPRTPGSTRLYLSGDRAGEIAALFSAGPLAARVLDAGPTAASGLKMVYAAWSKISSALLVAIDATADELGLAAALRDEWAQSQPELDERLARARSSAAAKGWRWEAEMREIATTFDAAGEPDGFATAAAELFARYPRPTTD
jgi:3-hydroxyisobutyrate dehydrogenase-like beta-hydroxyacid dehydrogenase